MRIPAVDDIKKVIFKDLDGGEDILNPEISVLVAPPLDLLAQPKGILSFDFDLSPGDNELFHLGGVGVGEEVSVEIYVND